MLFTTSFSLFKHFCGDNLVNISFEKVDNCCDSEVKTDAVANYKLNFSEKDCCKNETSIKELSIIDATRSLKILKSKTVFIVAYYFSFIENPDNFSTKNYWKYFSPSYSIFNKQIQFQSFLI